MIYISPTCIVFFYNTSLNTSSRMPIFTYHTVYTVDMTQMGFDLQPFTYNKFKDAWYSFLALIDVDFYKGCNFPVISEGDGDDLKRFLG